MGSGDGFYNYVSVVFFLLLLLLSMFVWIVLDKWQAYDWLLQVFIVLVCYYLVVQMVFYGMAKVFYV